MPIAWREVPWVLPVRAVQAIFAIIVLGLTAYVISTFDNVSFYYDDDFNPDTLNFMLFTSVWTLLVATPYLALSPLYVPQIAHRFAVVGMEVVTTIFWFAAFIALAVLLPPSGACHNSPCRSSQAATVFGAFEWVLFAVTAGFAIFNLIGGRGSRNKETVPEVQMAPHAGV
ncbi:conserved hypothetical protein [Paecilomyces variotii No. 5]|uniref:MARVEL domain-containing protein n=1 Tax=Byssochlamys spectabilis (strain No. 5 / NBRC 109023) TaxID=1356009 RepID=V5G4T6_BYSSN|nr:conserved hypothetical protein [Paecilomyces variotii No. 5]